MASAGIFPTQLKSKPRPPARLFLPHFENEQNQMHISIIEITLASTYAVCMCVCVWMFAVLLFYGKKHRKSGRGTRYAYTHYQAHNKRLPLPRALFIYLKTPLGRSSIMLHGKGGEGVGGRPVVWGIVYWENLFSHFRFNVIKWTCLALFHCQ